MNPIYLVALACPVGMGLMMFFMGKGMMGMGKGGGTHDEMPATPNGSADPEKRLAVLQAQRALIDAQIGAAAAESSARNDLPAGSPAPGVPR
jgi:hypothetical protein